MEKAFSLLTTALLGASLIGVTAVSAQTKSPPTQKCGPEVFSSATMTYTNVPCSGENTATSTASATPCKPEGFSGSDMTYSSVPCPAGQTYENPGWKGPKPK